MGHRKALITAGSIAVVIFAAAVAVGANLGILNAADSRPVGKLSAATVVQTATTKIVRVRQSAAPGTDARGAQEYIIKKAGTVSVAAAKGALRLVDVGPAHGWKWSLEQTADKRLTVTFRSGSKTYTFVASLGRHNSIVAKVDHPVTRVVPSAPSSGSYASSGAPAPVTSTASTTTTQTHYSESDDGGGGADD